MVQRRLWWRVRAMLAAAAILPVVALPASPAAAHRDPTVQVRMVSVEPALPSGVRVVVLDGERTYLGLSNDTATAAYVQDADGKPFLRVGRDGVFGDLKSPFLAAARGVAAAADEAPAGCCPGPGWKRLSREPRWAWPDPRLDPSLRGTATGDARGLGALAGGEPLAVWAVPVQMNGRTSAVKGVVERREVGAVTTTVESSPPELKVSVVDSRPPQLSISVRQGTTVSLIGRDGRPFIRLDTTGAFGRTDSADYQAARVAMGLPLKTGGLWTPVAGAAAAGVTWADPRLDYQAKLPTADVEGPVVLNTWRIPVIINGRDSEIRGQSVWKRAPVPKIAFAEKRGQSGTASYAVAGGLTVALIAAVLLVRRRARIVAE